MQSKTKWGVGVLIAAIVVIVSGILWSQRAPKTLTPWVWQLPPHFAQPVVPEDNPMSEEAFQLGRKLFYDKRLSGNGTFACASCHFQELAFTDGKSLPTGSTGERTLRSAQGLANVAYHPYYTWANYSLISIERQNLNPLQGDNPVEMGMNDQTQPVILQRIADDENYQAAFRQVFAQDEQPINLGNLVKALATFQRGMISANSKYDQFLQSKATLTAQEERGRKLFFSDQAQCSQCHGSYNFNDQLRDVTSKEIKTAFHNTGLYNIDGKGGFPDGNRGILELSGQPADMGMFRAPSLRNVEVTAPYMHDGSIANLEQVLDFYASHGRVITAGPFKGDGRKSPRKDKRIDKIQLDAQDKSDIIAFLHTLTDDEFLANPRFSNPFEAKNATH